MNQAAFPTAGDLLVAISRCPIMESHLEGRGGDQPCGKLVLHQWANVPSAEARARRWRREHHAPLPWIGHLEHAPILFISSNPNLPKSELRGPEEVPIPEPDPRPELLGKRVADHPSLRKPFRAPKWYWAADEMIDLCDNHFEVWVKDDGMTPLSGSSSRRRKVPYWEFARDQAQHLVSGRAVRPGHDYALTEVVHCKSAGEKAVDAALATCAGRYLAAVVARSPAKVLVVAGVVAAEAFRQTFGVPAHPPMVGPLSIAGAERLLLYTPHPGLSQWEPEKVEALTLPQAVSSAQMDQLRAAVTARPGEDSGAALT